ncbi:MAG: restriction endonuclease subunit S, partial [Defluviitaleaceae bacterium]|nr:restriction endonuclease subunit S [Defluviitaleaceae bacterium]
MELSKSAQGKSVVHINNSDLKDVVLQLPSLPEQTAIGTFFRTLDELLASNQRKVDGLKKMKS